MNALRRAKNPAPDIDYHAEAVKVQKAEEQKLRAEITEQIERESKQKREIDLKIEQEANLLRQQSERDRYRQKEEEAATREVEREQRRVETATKLKQYEADDAKRREQEEL
jgi:hypothetical protein